MFPSFKAVATPTLISFFMITLSLTRLELRRWSLITQIMYKTIALVVFFRSRARFRKVHNVFERSMKLAKLTNRIFDFDLWPNFVLFS